MNDTAKMIQQKGKGKWSLFLSILIGFLVCASAYSQSVVVFEQADFGGRSKTLSVGDHKLSDLNDVVSSIKVPAGLVAFIFDQADDVGGFGIWVDLMEDHADLTQLGFNDKTSFVKVFASPNAQGFIWARNTMRNGQFIGGHWERAKASGNPINPTAVVAPPLQKSSPSTGGGVDIRDHRKTEIQVTDGQSVITQLGDQNSDDASLWNRADTDLMGVIGSDYRRKEEIGSANFERAGKLGPGPIDIIPDNIDMWFPQKRKNTERPAYYKHTLVGTLNPSPKIYNNTVVYPDHDVNIYIQPDPAYMYMISEGHKPELGTAQSIKETFTENTDCTLPFKHVEAEIDSSERAKDLLVTRARTRLGKKFAVYGPWVFDNGHCHQPEIHPAEQIWWSENVGVNKKYNLNLFSDSSERFWWRNQMDSGTELKPWGAPPIKGTFAIAFEAEIGKIARRYDVTDLLTDNVIAFPNADKVYSLMYENKALITFVPHTSAFKVTFEKVGKKPGNPNIVRGFLVLETSVGTLTQVKSGLLSDGFGTYEVAQGADVNKVPKPIERIAFKKVAGHYMFSISLIMDPTKLTDTPSDPTIKPILPCERKRMDLIRANQLLKSEEESLRKLNTDLARAPVGEKPGIQTEIDEKKTDIIQVKARIVQAQKALEKCRLENPQ